MTTPPAAPGVLHYARLYPRWRPIPADPQAVEAIRWLAEAGEVEAVGGEFRARAERGEG